jgi:hypothetical protein
MEEQMLRSVVILVLVFGLSGEITVRADDKCELKFDSQDAVKDCAIKAEPIKNAIARVDHATSKLSAKPSAEEQKKSAQDAREDSDILVELLKQ